MGSGASTASKAEDPQLVHRRNAIRKINRSMAATKKMSGPGSEAKKKAALARLGTQRDAEQAALLRLERRLHTADQAQSQAAAAAAGWARHRKVYAELAKPLVVVLAEPVKERRRALMSRLPSRTPAAGQLVKAVQQGDIASVVALLKRGADPQETVPMESQSATSRRQNPGWSALHFAADGGSVGIIQLLAEAAGAEFADGPGQRLITPTKMNVDPRASDAHGTTPLMIAVAAENLQVLELLAKLGADPRADKTGMTMLGIGMLGMGMGMAAEDDDAGDCSIM